MKVCSKCGITKTRIEFSWNDAIHKYKDSRCKQCNAVSAAKRRKPKNSCKQYTFPEGVSSDMYNALEPSILAYTAGIIDGEGCITSSLPKTNHRPLCIKLLMIHKPTVAWLHKTFGGSFGAHRTN